MPSSKSCFLLISLIIQFHKIQKPSFSTSATASILAFSRPQIQLNRTRITRRTYNGLSHSAKFFTQFRLSANFNEFDNAMQLRFRSDMLEGKARRAYDAISIADRNLVAIETAITTACSKPATHHLLELHKRKPAQAILLSATPRPFSAWQPLV